MSYLRQENTAFVFHDAFDKPQKLLEFGNPVENKSTLLQVLLWEELQSALPKIFDGTPVAMLNGVIYLRTVAHLLQKPQIHHVLLIGSLLPLGVVLSGTLPKFNPNNKLYCYVAHRPIGKFERVNFIFAETIGGEYPIQENKFASIIFPEFKVPPLEILLAAEDYGKIYFVAPNENFPDFLRQFATSFALEPNISLFELEVAPNLKRELRRHTLQGHLEERKSQIIKIIEKMPAVMKKVGTLSGKKKNPYLDEYINEITNAEMVLADIFPLIKSATIKFNFNLLKEFLIDFRLYDNPRLKKIALEDLTRQHEILLRDLQNS